MISIKSSHQFIAVLSVKILSILLLIIAINTYLDSRGFYTFLRIFICGSSIFIGYLSYKRDDKKGIIFFSVIAFIFNPFFPLYTYSKQAWQLIDTFSIGAFVYSIFSYIGYLNRPQIKASLVKEDANLPQRPLIPEQGRKYLNLAMEMEKKSGDSTLFGNPRLETALILYRDALACDPNLIEAYIHIGDINLKMQHDYKIDFDKTISDLNNAINLFPDKPELYKLRGMILLCKSRRVIVSDKKSRVSLMLSGINDLTEYLKTNPEDEHVNELKGETYYELEKINPAAVASMFLDAGLRGVGSWALYYARKRQKYGSHTRQTKS